MSSLGGQWRVIRHYLSMSNLNAELDKLVQRLKPATPDQWDNLLKRFEKVVSARVAPNVDVDKTDQGVRVQATAIEGTTDAKPVSKEKEEPVSKEVAAPSVGTDAKELTMDSLLQGLRLKKDIHLGKISEPLWKDQKHTVTKTSIHARTAYVISALLSADSPECVLRRTERLVEHLHTYPEARDYAIKEGAVRALLRVQHGLQSTAPLSAEIGGAVREALALVGWCGAPGGPGARVLALDGGGIRGLIAIELLQHLEQLTGRKVHELFDFVVGVSTGAIIAALLSAGGSLQTARHMYYTLSRDMFGGTSRLSGGARLVWTHSYYDTQAWERLLRAQLGERTLAQCNRAGAPRLALVSCVVSGARLAPFLFRSYVSGWRVRSVFAGTARAKLWHAVRASAAAPTYFDEFTLDGMLHQDGGILVNNPTGVGVHEARLVFGAEAVRRGVVVSLGTGRPLQHVPRAKHDHTPTYTSWRDKFNKILDSATDTEGVHLVMNDLLPPGSYYRFNPPLMQPCAMDEIDTEKLDNLVVDTQAYIRRNQQKFRQAAAMLTRPRPLSQRVVDYVQYRAQLAGATALY